MRLPRRAVLGTVMSGLALSDARRASGQDAPVATTTAGLVRGTTETGIHVFKGVPYGASTAGTGRFRPPQPLAPWSGVRDALAFVPMCPQVVRGVGEIFASWTFDTEVSEDCLAVNVWTPALADGGKRPVMVWLHGGDFSSLSGSRNVFDGTRLAHKGDVVVVTLNHRLNVFGHLQLAQFAPEYADAGNAGLLDLVQALTWIRDNIAAFGGDPGNVTIFGQSGGGGKVSCLMAMPAAAGLFHRAIVQSGSYYLKAMDAEEAAGLTRKLLTALDLSPAEIGKLATMPAAALVAGLEKAQKTPGGLNPRPVADGRALPSGPWAPAAPEFSRNVPMIIGTVATEMTLLTGAGDPATFTLDEAALRQRMVRWFAPGDIDRVLATFRETWPGATPSDLYFAIDTDMSMRNGAWQQAGRKAAQSGAPVWLYEVDWRTPVGGGKWRTPHSVELAFVFDNVAKSAAMVGTGPEPQALADQMSATWLAFARNGRPDNPSIPAWPPYTEAERATMVFDVNSHVVPDHRGAERKLLATLPVKSAG